MDKELKKTQVAIIGGGLAGLISSIVLSKASISVILIEKKQYPFHRVCGEYVSNEVIPFLKSIDAFPPNLDIADITQFEISAISGRNTLLELDLGGFGISRFNFDHFLYKKAQEFGVTFIHDNVEDVIFEGDDFTIKLKSTYDVICNVAIGAFGKRSNLDNRLKRRFFSRPSPYVGIKYHINYDIERSVVALHNFNGGYCGINAIEDNHVNLCYLSHRDNLKKYKNIEEMERQVLCKNPHLAKIFQEAEFLFDSPEVINEISFETKSPVENHLLMCGDAAGMITPLCGNGMAMAIHGAKLLCEQIINYQSHGNRSKLENDYRKRWNAKFKNRLAVGRQIQKLFGSGSLSDFSVTLSKFKPVANYLVKLTHGDPF